MGLAKIMHLVPERMRFGKHRRLRTGYTIGNWKLRGLFPPLTGCVASAQAFGLSVASLPSGVIVTLPWRFHRVLRQDSG